MILRKFYLHILYGNIPDIKIISDVVAITNVLAIFQHSFFHNSKKIFFLGLISPLNYPVVNSLRSSHFCLNESGMA